MPSLDYKVSLDSTALNTGLKSVGAAQSAFGAFSSLLRGDFVSAAVQARNAFIALKAAMIANPFVALAGALLAVGAALAAVAWRKHQADIEAFKKATEELADATERYNRTVKDIAFKRADDSGKLKMLQEEREKLDYELYVQKNMGTASDPAAEARRLAEIKRLETELAVKDGEIRDVRDRIRASREKAAAEQAQAQKQFDDRRATLRSRADALSEELRRGSSDYTDRDHEKELIAAIAALERERAGILFDVMRRDELGVTILERKIELQRIQNRLAAEEAENKDAAARRMAGVHKAEAEYAFSKLTPEQQLAAINARARELMDKRGWEKDTSARAELLDLRKRRDDNLDAKKQPPAPAGKTYRQLESEEMIDVMERLRRRRTDSVIRMRGSRAGGFIDDMGIQRMTGSLAGGFASRLRPTAFARTAAELDAKRRGIASASESRTGEEQPVELKGDAVTYLRIMASVLGKEA